jgi:hypothetical protein
MRRHINQESILVYTDVIHNINKHDMDGDKLWQSIGMVTNS